MKDGRGVVFSALAAPLYKQLGLPMRRLRYLQECADSIVTLAVGGLLADAEMHRARKRLIKRIAQVVQAGADRSRRARGVQEER